MGCALGHMVYELWGMGYGVWAMGYGLWAMGYGVWAMGYGLWAMGDAVCGMGYGLWAMGYGVRGGVEDGGVLRGAQMVVLVLVLVLQMLGGGWLGQHGDRARRACGGAVGGHATRPGGERLVCARVRC